MIIAFEGIDGSGKTTAVDATADWLRQRGREVVVMRWTSFLGDSGDETTPFELAHKLKSGHEMGPLSFALWHCADFAHRWETVALPAIEQNIIILSDRYKYSGLVRSVTRGVDEAFLRHIYKFVPEADCVLYLDVDAQTALHRKIGSNGNPGFYESGNDLYPELKRTDAFLAFQEHCRSLYLKVLPTDGVVHMDALLPVDDVLQAIQTKIGKVINSQRGC